MKERKFTEYLVEKKLISPEELKNILSAQKKEKKRSLAQTLINSGRMDEQQILSVLSEYMDIPAIRTLNLNIPEEVLRVVPEKIARQHCILPIGRIGNAVTVAMADPLDVLAIDDLKKTTNCQINPVIALLSEIKEAIHNYYTQKPQEVLEEITKDKKIKGLEVIKEKKEEISTEQILRFLEEAPVVKFTNYLLKRAVEARASDILIEPLNKTSRARFRIDGILREAESFYKKMHPFVISRIKVMCNLNITESRLPQEGRFRKKISGKDIDFRVSILPSSGGEKAALRILDKSVALLDLNLVGFEAELVKKLKKDSLRPHGLILVCGPTGSGKTTSLYSLIKHIYTPEKNIMTVEDPIEYQLKGINQISINPAIGLTFASCLRSILRQDPDVIMIGEIRDADTADIAIKAALTGHLVLSTLHTTTSAGSITRLLNMGIEPFLLSSTLIGVLAQRLVRKLCPRCKEENKLTDNVREKYTIKKEIKVYRAKGCAGCQGMGYKGRTVLSEYLAVHPKIKSLINNCAPEQAIKREARLSGMHTLRDDGMIKMENGITGLEEVLKITAPDEALE